MNGPMLRIWILATAVLALAFALPAATADETTPSTDDAGDKCAQGVAPPCGYIYPTIGMDADGIKIPYPTSELDKLPSEVDVKIRYYWDMEQDGTGVPGNADPMKVTVVISKKPQWLSASLDRATCEFQLIPVTSEYDVCTIKLSLKVIDNPETGEPWYPLDETEFEALGKRLMLFATSEESGTFKKSYGVEDMRFKWDGVPEGASANASSVDTDDAVTVPGPGLAATLALAGLAAIALRRRP